LCDTTEEVFLRRGVQWRKMIQGRMILLNFKCLSLPSNKNLGKISYLNSQTNSWKELKMESYMVNHEKKIFFPISHFLIFIVKNFAKINFSAK
jgi:hypothetical protein